MGVFKKDSLDGEWFPVYKGGGVLLEGQGVVRESDVDLSPKVRR